MTAQDRDTIIAALVSRIAGQVTDFKLVTARDTISKDIPGDKWPACIVLEGRDDVSYSMTGTVKYEFYVGIRIWAKVSADNVDSQVASARSLHQQVVEALRTDPTLGDTCTRCLVIGSDPPFNWPESDGTINRDLICRVNQRRNVT